MKKKFFLALLVCTLCCSIFCSAIRQPEPAPDAGPDTAPLEGPQAGHSEPQPVPEPKPETAKTTNVKKIISQNEFSIEVNVSLEGFNGVELWYTLDYGDNWLLFSTTEGRPKALKFTAPRDGYYGFLAIPVDNYNKRAYMPKSGVKPDVTVLVDTTAPQVVLESPNGGNTFKNEGYELIKWSAMDENIAPLPVTIEVSSDSGKSWGKVSENEPNTGKFYWKVPAISSAKYRVRVKVSDQAGLTGSDESDNDFSIDGLAPDSVIISPAKSKLNDIELQYKVEDVGGAGVAGVELWITRDNGASWERYGEDKKCVSPFKFTAIDGTYGLKLVVIDRVGNTSAIPSAGTKPPFNIIVDSQKPQVKLLSFLDVNRIYAGNYSYPVTWLARDSNLIDNSITIQFTDDGGLTWQGLPQGADISNDVQPYTWKTPGKLGNNCKIRVIARDLLDNIGIAESPVFRIDPFIPEIKITGVKPNTLNGVPVEYQIVNTGISQIKKVFVWYTKDNGFSWHKYAEDTGMKSPMLVNLTDGDYGLIFTCVTELGEDTGRFVQAPKKGDAAGMNITIDMTPPKVELKSFIGNNTYKGGNKEEIAWNAVDPHLFENCFIEYSEDSGMHWKLVADKVPSVLGKYAWQIPIETGSTYRVRAVFSDTYDNAATAMSAVDFAIDSAPPVCQAIAPEAATAKGFQVIYKAQDSGAAGLNEVKLFIAKLIDGRVSEWKEYANTREHPFTFKVGVDSDGAYGFRVVATDKVGNASAYPSVNTPPDSVTFVDSTPPSVQLITMRGVDIFKGGSVQQIKFRASDNYSKDLNFTIYYSNNEGHVWTKVADNLNLPVGEQNIYTYNWLLPAETGNLYRVRVETKDACENFKSSESDANFAIDSAAPVAILTGPVLARNQNVQLAYTAKETGKAGIKFFNLYFRLRGEKDYRKYKEFTGSEPVVALTAPDGNYELFLACEDGVGNRMPAPDRETAPQLQLVIDTKAPAVNLLTLTGGEIIGSEKNLIRWEAADENPAEFFITIELSLDGGRIWTVLAAQQKNSGYYEWTPPKDLNSAQCKIRVSTADAVGIHGEAVSSGTFTVDTSAPIIKALEPVIAVSRPVMVKFYAEDKGPAGLKTIEAYVSKNSSKIWDMFASMPAADIRDSQMPLNLPDGQFNLYFVAVDQAGNRSVSPAVDKPQLSILVDTIKPLVTFRGIDSGSIYRGTATVPLSWEVTDENPSARPVSIRWSMDLGKSWNIVAENLLPKDKFDWKLPDKGGRYVVSLKAVDIAGNSDEITLPFILDSMPPVLKTIGEVSGILKGNSTIEIQWQSSDDNFSDKPVSILFSSNNGKDWEYVEKEFANTGKYIWQVKAVTSPECLLQIAAKDKTGNHAEKTFSFAIDSDAPVCRIKGPAFSTSQAVAISYESSDAGKAGISGYSLYSRSRGEREYRKYKDFPGAEPVISFTAKDGVYDIVLSCRDGAGNETPIPGSDTAAQLQLIIDSVPPKVMLLNLSGGEIFGKSGREFIQWSATDEILMDLSVDIEFSADAGKTWVPVADNLKNTGLYEWVMPANINSSDCKVKVSALSVTGARGEAVTPGVFTIDTAEPFIKATEPVVSNLRPVVIGCVVDDKGPAGMKEVDVYVSRNMGQSWELFRTVSYAEIRDNAIQLILADNRYSIFLSARDKAGNQSAAPANGSKPQLTITVDTVKPEFDFNGIAQGDVFKGGMLVNLAWQVKDSNNTVDPISISYSSDAGNSWKKLFENQPALGKFEWKIPEKTGKYILNAVCRDIAGNIDARQVPFIVDNEPPSVKVATGISGVLKGGDTIELKWDAVDENFPDKPVSIMFSRDNGKTFEFVEKDMPNSGYYPWRMPLITSSTCLLKLVVKDKVGNLKEQSFCTKAFSIDSAPPSVNILNVVVLENEGALVKYRAEDVGDSGIELVELYQTENNGLTWAKTDEQKGRGAEFKMKLGSGTYGVYLVAKDKVGNRSPAEQPGYGTKAQKVFEIQTGEQRIVMDGFFENGTYETGSVLKFGWNVLKVTDPVRVKLEFFRQDMIQEWEKSVSGLKAKDSYTVRLSSAPGRYNIRLTAYDNDNEILSRTVPFELKEKEAPAPVVTDVELLKLISPVNDGAYRSGSKIEIKWQGKDEFLRPKSVQAEYSIDNGKNWTVIDRNLNPTDSLTWTAPQKDVFVCRIRVRGLTVTEREVSDEIPTSIRIDIAPPNVQLEFKKPKDQKPLKQEIPEISNTAEDLHNLGKEYYNGRNYEMAAQVFKKALELEPNSSVVRNDLCAAYIVLKEYAKATEELEKSIMQGESPENRFNLGLVWVLQKNYGKAKQQYLRAVELAPDKVDYVYELGLTCKQLKDFSEAKAYFEKTIAIDPDSNFAAEAKKELNALK